ncbi:related to Importin subunit beta-5 [Saccharomycodes ludwigii]|uniref:Related to Importin subunit beta-5 n=1 Tax=Saccharomycodes ludwigii TaxID=36035 RepID=A0A376BB22_9ASCO|nr:related to Importin subunit beta-5 [Saccharomycodes ludwigii]
MLDFNQLIANAQSSDNLTRENAENTLFTQCSVNPSVIFQQLLQLGSDSTQSLSTRQFCLLSTRKLVTMYWSTDFESFKGPQIVDDAVKIYIRSVLLQLCLDDSQDSKIKNSASYCIVQISAVDFPDQWPDLLSVIYGAIINNGSISGLELLNEIFDDVVNDSMFYEENIGFQTIKIIIQVLNDSNLPLKAKSAALKLYHSCALQFEEPKADNYTDAINQHLKEIVILFCQLLTFDQNFTNPTSEYFAFKSNLSIDLLFIKTTFGIKVFSSDCKKKLILQMEKDLNEFANVYNTQKDLSSEFVECCINLISLASSLQNGFTNIEQINSIIDAFISLAQITQEQEDVWTADLNEFVSVETELSASFTIRDEICDFLNNVVPKAFHLYFESIISKIESQALNNDWKLFESLLFLLESIVLNLDEDTAESNPRIPVDRLLNLLNFFSQLLESKNLNNFVQLRLWLLIPRFIERFMDSLPNVKDIVKKFIFASLKSANDSDSAIVQVSSLISFTYYESFVELPSVLGPNLSFFMEQDILKIINNLSEDAEEDTPGMLLESLNSASKLTSCSEQTKSVKYNELQLILKVSSKSPDNIQVVMESQECLETLLQDVDVSTYLQFSEVCMPTFVKVMNGATENYSSILTLVLELLTSFMKKKPSDGNLPTVIIEFVFSPLANVLMISQDDGILQMGSEALSFCISNSDVASLQKYLGTILQILERLFSCSDSGAMNIGILVISVLKKFTSQLEQGIIPSILKAAAKKLVEVQNISTTENLIFVFCYLTCTNPSQTVDFLASFNLDNDGNALKLVIQKWLEAFEIIRGERKIKENIISLSKLFFLQDPRINDIVVNGDIIPYEGNLIITRSMSRKMPIKFTQISVPVKIVKLFVTELGLQTAMSKKVENECIEEALHNHQDQSNCEGVEENDDWEDVDDVLDYKRLQEFINEDAYEEDNYEETDGCAEDINDFGDENINKQLNSNSIKDLLIQFFTEAASHNTNSFSIIYQSLDEKDKKLLTKTLV